MIKLVNDSIIETAKLLVSIMLSNDLTKSGDKFYLELLQTHLDNKKPDGSHPKYSISNLKFLIRYLGPKYLLE